MRKLFLATLTFLAIASSSFAQQKPNWEKWNWLIGQWQGEGSGQPGQGGGIFNFYYDLDKNIVTRKSHSEYPATPNKPKIVHDDLMIVYLDMAGNPSKAIYFDNEGHTINYTLSYTDKTIAFLSEKTSVATVFRLTYTLLDDKTINTKFEFSQDGQQFKTYIEGKSKKISEVRN